MSALFLVGSLTRGRRNRFFGFMVDGLLFNEGSLAGFVQGVQQFEVPRGIELLVCRKTFVTIWKLRVDGQNWFFVHPRSVRATGEVQKGALPRNSSALNRKQLSERLANLGWLKYVKFEGRW
jgi:hypothetical protein